MTRLSLPRRPAAAIARTAGRLSRRLGRGGGTTLPGLLLNRLRPQATAEMAAAIPDGVILLSGTNGKTTTARLIRAALDSSGARVVANTAGSNLERGVATALLHADSADIALFEVDEAALGALVAQTRPRVVVLMNLFRDQLDRYGELEHLAQSWRAVVAELDPDTTLVYNADDPAVAEIGVGHPNSVSYGIEDPDVGREHRSHAADNTDCRRCDAPLQYRLVTIGHLGRWECPSCGLTRPQPDVRATNVEFQGMDGQQLIISTADETTSRPTSRQIDTPTNVTTSARIDTPTTESTTGGGISEPPTTESTTGGISEPPTTESTTGGISEPPDGESTTGGISEPPDGESTTGGISEPPVGESTTGGISEPTSDTTNAPTNDTTTGGISGPSVGGSSSASIDVTLRLPGLPNTYNAVAAAATALAVGLAPETVAEALGKRGAAFGRAEHVSVGQTRVTTLLAKNPAGANENLRMVLNESDPLHLLILLNDRTADGQDVSWIWDVDYELLLDQDRPASLTLGGTRAHDLALRFRYAGADTERMAVVPEPAAAFDTALQACGPRGRLYVLPTYTAMLDFRGVLAGRGLVREFWEDQ